jgi:hypothetical protein
MLTDSVFSGVRDFYLDRELALQEHLYNARLATFKGLLAPSWIERERANSNHLPWENAGFDATHDMSLDDLELTKFFLSRNRTALERCVKLSHAKDVAPNVTALYKLLLRCFGHSTVSAAVALHVDMVPDKPNLKKELDVSFLYVALAVNTIVLDLEHFHHSVVMPRVSGSINEPTKCKSMKDKLVHTLEQKLSAGLQKLVRVMAAQVWCACVALVRTTHSIWQAEAILSNRQKRGDYRVVADAFVSRPTAACAAVCEWLDAKLLQITSCLDGGNAEVRERERGRGRGRSSVLVGFWGADG